MKESPRQLAPEKPLTDFENRQGREQPLSHTEALRRAEKKNTTICQEQDAERADRAVPAVYPRVISELEKAEQKARKALEDIQAQRSQHGQMILEWDGMCTVAEGIEARIASAVEMTENLRAKLKEAESRFLEIVGGLPDPAADWEQLAHAIPQSRAALPLYENGIDALRKKLSAHFLQMRSFGKANGIPEDVWPHVPK